MAAYYFDTSALVKRYAHETGSAWVTQVTDRAAGHSLFTGRLIGPEMISALFRKVRLGALALADAQYAATAFRFDWQRQYAIVEVSVAIADEAMRLAEVYGLRGYDAVHLSTALQVASARQARQLTALIFVSGDDDQCNAALAENLAVENPNRYP